MDTLLQFCVVFLIIKSAKILATKKFHSIVSFSKSISIIIDYIRKRLKCRIIASRIHDTRLEYFLCVTSILYLDLPDTMISCPFMAKVYFHTNIAFLLFICLKSDTYKNHIYIRVSKVLNYAFLCFVIDPSTWLTKIHKKVQEKEMI